MQQLDLKGLTCPLPILKTKKALSKLKSGDVLCVWTTDKSAPIDFKKFCQQTGHILQAIIGLDCAYKILIQHK